VSRIRIAHRGTIYFNPLRIVEEQLCKGRFVIREQAARERAFPFLEGGFAAERVNRNITSACGRRECTSLKNATQLVQVVGSASSQHVYKIGHNDIRNVRIQVKKVHTVENLQTLGTHALKNVEVGAVDHSDGLQVLSGCIICSGFLRGDALDGITDKAARCGENTLAFLKNTPVLSGSEQREKTVKRSLAVAAHEQKV